MTDTLRALNIAGYALSVDSLKTDSSGYNRATLCDPQNYSLGALPATSGSALVNEECYVFSRSPAALDGISLRTAHKKKIEFKLYLDFTSYSGLFPSYLSHHILVILELTPLWLMCLIY